MDKSLNRTLALQATALNIILWLFRQFRYEHKLEIIAEIFKTQIERITPNHTINYATNHDAPFVKILILGTVL